MKTNYLYGALAVLILAACKKDVLPPETEDVPSPTYTVPHTANSYWVYEWIKIDSDGVETTLNMRDSIYIQGDTVVNGQTYTHFRGTRTGISYYDYLQRDSAGYVVNENGSIHYSYVNFNDVLKSGNSMEWNYNLKMNKLLPVSVPAGTFKGIEAQSTYSNPDGGPANDCGDPSFTLGTWYVDGVGQVLIQTGFVSELQACAGYIERRLVDYHIE